VACLNGTVINKKEWIVVMVNNVVHVSLFSFALSLSACINDASADAHAARGQSALSGQSLRLRDHATLRCLDSNADGKVYAMDCNGGDFQRWNLAWVSYGFQLRDAATARCLDSNTSGEVYTLPCNGGAFQQWTFDTDTEGYVIKDVATGRCLDSNADGKVYAFDCNGGNFQHWLR